MEHRHDIPFPLKLLALATTVSLALLTSLGWYIRSSSRAIASVQAQEFRALEVMGAARLAKVNRATSARQGAVNGANPNWRRQHAASQLEWKAALAELQRLAPAEFRSEAGRRVASSVARLLEIEVEAFDLASQGQGDRAMALLFAEPYVREERTLSESAEQITGWLRDRLQSVLDSQRRRNTRATVLFAMVSPLVLCLWIIVWRITRRRLDFRYAEESRLRESEQRLRTLFEGIEDALLVHDLDGRILDCNPAASRRLGYTREELLALRTSAIETPEFAAGFPQRCVRQMARGVYVWEGVHRAKDGSHIPVDLNTRVITYQGGPAILSTIRDITERKRVETELEMLREAAEEANQAKSQFLANMSHEIRTPMNGILGMTALTLDTELSAEQREYLLMVQISADSLLKLINDILDFSKIEAGKLELDPIEFGLRDCLADMIKALAGKAHEKGLDLAFSVAPEVPDQLFGDPGRLKQVIVNLVGNAIKFTKKGEVLVAVEASAPAPGESVLHFTVTDTGKGIAPNSLKVIFEPFRQEDGSTTRKYGGTGLGLAISAQLVGLMGGEIWAHSEPGKGSAFHFTARLGILEPAGVGNRQRPSPGCDLLGISVLVVDENGASRRILEEMLTNWGMAPVVVDGVEPALEAFDHAVADGQPFGLMILDPKISGDKGFEMLESMRARPLSGSLAVIVLTSTTVWNETEKLRALGISAYLHKPIKQSELLDAITVTIAAESLRGLGAFSNQPSGRLEDGVRAGKPPVKTFQARRVLVAEDNPVNQRLFVRMLEKRGHSVFLVSNGREAVAALAREKFDIALLDIQMPEMSGIEATAAIRERERLASRPAHIPIVAITANAMKGDRERFLAAGMDGYLSKPINQDELFQVVENKLIIQVPSSRISFDGALFDGDSEFLAEIVNLFLETYPDLLFAIEDAVSRKDAAALCRAAHTLKGAVANFGAQAVVDQANALETMGKAGDLSSVDSALQLLQDLLERFVTELKVISRSVLEKQVTT